MSNPNSAPNYRRRRIVTAATIVGAIAGGAVFAGKAIDNQDKQDGKPPATGTYMVHTGERAWDIAKEFTDTRVNFNHILDQVNSQSPDGTKAGQEIKIDLQYIDDPNPPAFEQSDLVGPKLPKQ